MVAADEVLALEKERVEGLERRVERGFTSRRDFSFVASPTSAVATSPGYWPKPSAGYVARARNG
jgi:hypothetical protein